MKKFNLWGVAAAALALLTSCLDGNGGTEQSFSGLLGVVTTSETTYKPVVRTVVGDLYNEEIETMGFGPGSCIQFSCKYDSNNPNNANDYVNQYTYVTVTGTPVAVDKVNVSMTSSDTTKLLNEQEIVIENPIANPSSGTTFHPNIGGYMFLTSSFKGLTDQKNEWSMSFDMNQKPIEENNTNTYVFVLRAVKTEEGKTPSIVQGQLNAFNVQTILNQLNRIEYGNSKEKFNIRIKYLKAINEKDSTDLEWGYSDYFSFSTAKE